MDKTIHRWCHVTCFIGAVSSATERARKTAHLKGTIWLHGLIQIFLWFCPLFLFCVWLRHFDRKFDHIFFSFFFNFENSLKCFRVLKIFKIFSSLLLIPELSLTVIFVAIWNSYCCLINKYSQECIWRAFWFDFDVNKSNYTVVVTCFFWRRITCR